MSIVINNATNNNKIFNKKFVYLRSKLLDYIKSNRLLYLKSPLNKLLYLHSSDTSYINFIVKKSKNLSRDDFKNFLLTLLEKNLIEVKTYKRKKENLETNNKRQKNYSEKKKENFQLLQFYINKDTFHLLEEKRIKQHISKQEFYSLLLDNSID